MWVLTDKGEAIIAWYKRASQVTGSTGQSWEGQSRCNAPSVETESGKAHLRHSASSACFSSGPILAEGIMAQRPPRAALTGRTHGRTDRRAEHQNSLANEEPSTHRATPTACSTVIYKLYRSHVVLTSLSDEALLSI